MTYLASFVKETLRCYPPGAANFPRICHKSHYICKDTPHELFIKKILSAFLYFLLIIIPNITKTPTSLLEIDLLSYLNRRIATSSCLLVKERGNVLDKTCFIWKAKWLLFTF